MKDRIKVLHLSNELRDKNMHCIHMPYDQMNPYQSALFEGLRENGVSVSGSAFKWAILKVGLTCDIIHIHWTYEAYYTKIRIFLFAYPLFAIQMLLLRLMGKRLVWTVHNLDHHEKKNRLRDRLTSMLLGHLANHVVVHGMAARKIIAKSYGISEKRISVIPHGNYIGLYPNSISSVSARRILDIADSKTVVLFLGQIRVYKGIEQLIGEFRDMDNAESMLLVVGKPLTPEYGRKISESLSGLKHCQYVPGFVPDDKVQVYMHAADIVAFPYRDVLTSGAVVLAMSYGRACIAHRLGCISDMLDDRGAFLYDPDERRGLRKALRRALHSKGQLELMGQHNQEKVKQWSWNRIGRVMSELYVGRTALDFESYFKNDSKHSSKGDPRDK